jgi:hypothetical protein
LTYKISEVAGTRQHRLKRLFMRRLSGLAAKD